MRRYLLISLDKSCLVSQQLTGAEKVCASNLTIGFGENPFFYSKELERCSHTHTHTRTQLDAEITHTQTCTGNINNTKTQMTQVRKIDRFVMVYLNF